MLDHILLFCEICLIAIPVYILFRRPWRFKGRLNKTREWLLGFFWVFMFGLLFMTFWALYPPFENLWDNAVYRMRNGYNINFIPFHNIRMMYLYDDHEHFIMNMLGNTLMFIPWGFLRPLLWKKQRRFSSALCGAFLLTLFIETVQLFTYNRTVDIDDIILNAAAALFGSLLYLIVGTIWPGVKKLAK